jgi:primase-polymerase (primpol)-like protein
MSVNISALLNLLPEPSSASTASNEEGGRTFPLSLRRSEPDAITPDFIAAVESVRSHERWGRVFVGDLSDYGGDHSHADLALCGEFARLGLKAGGIDTAIRASALYRDKWERD